MHDNHWHKKENPLLGTLGLGGGLGFGGGPPGWYPSDDPGGISATGGRVVDYPYGGNNYRAHIFYSPGTFEVVRLAQDSPNYPNQIE